jgi:ribosomal protein L1
MTDAEIADNIHTVISRVEARLPKGLKNIREVGVKTTMGPFTKVVFQN